MASKFINFSFTIDATDDEAKDFESMVTAYDRIATDQLDMDEDEHLAEYVDRIKSSGMFTDSGSLGISTENAGDYLGIYSEGNGNLEALMDLLKHHLAHFNSDQIIVFTYSETCDRPRYGAFGGGAVVITKDSIQNIDAMGAGKAAAKLIEDARALDAPKM